MKKPCIQRNHEREAGVGVIPAHDDWPLSFEYLDNRSLQPFFPVIIVYPATPESPPGRLFFSSDFDKHPVFVERIFHVPGRNKDVFLVSSPVIRDQKSIPVPMAAQDSGNEIFAGWKRVAPAFDAVNNPFCIQFVQVTLQAPAFIAVQVQCPNRVAKTKTMAFQRPYKLQKLILLSNR